MPSKTKPSPAQRWLLTLLKDGWTLYHWQGGINPDYAFVDKKGRKRNIRIHSTTAHLVAKRGWLTVKESDYRRTISTISAAGRAALKDSDHA